MYRLFTFIGDQYERRFLSAYAAADFARDNGCASGWFIAVYDDDEWHIVCRDPLQSV
jgi:hypothetical protein